MILRRGGKNRHSESCSVVSDSLRPYEVYSPWNSPGQDTGVGSLSLPQGIFLTQRLNPGLPHCRQILYQLSHKGSPLTGTKNGLSLAWSPQHSSQGLAPGWHHGIVPFNDGHRSRTGLWPFGFPPSTQLGKGAQGVCCSVAQSCGTLCNPMDCSTPDFPVLHYLPELVPTRVPSR